MFFFFFFFQFNFIHQLLYFFLQFTHFLIILPINQQIINYIDFILYIFKVLLHTSLI